jgi:hypothetical protein
MPKPMRKSGQKACVVRGVLLGSLILMAQPGWFFEAAAQTPETMVLEEFYREGNTIVGYVVDTTRLPVDGATVIARGPMGQARTTTDKSGRFVIRMAEPDFTELTIERRGFQPLHISLEDVVQFVPFTLSMRVHADGTTRLLVPEIVDDEIVRLVVVTVDPEDLVAALVEAGAEGMFVEVRADRETQAWMILRAMGAAMQAGVEDVRFVGLPEIED